MGPLYTGGVIVVDNDGAISVCIFEAEVCEDVGYLLEGLCAFVYGADFGFAGAACSVCLAFGRPCERSSEPDNVSCDGAGLEEV